MGLKPVQILKRPYCLPKIRTMAYNSQEPVYTISDYSYKIDSSINVSADTQLETLFDLDTGVGPNLILYDHLPDELLLLLDKKKQVVNLGSASTH